LWAIAVLLPCSAILPNKVLLCNRHLARSVSMKNTANWKDSVIIKMS
jgi:hypothetical protein